MHISEEDPERVLGSDLQVLRDVIRYLGEADPRLVRGSLGQLRTAFLDLWALIDNVEKRRGTNWHDRSGDGTHLATGP